jgi:hypothetical protein
LRDGHAGRSTGRAAFVNGWTVPAIGVESSGRHRHSRTLEIEFTSGGAYRYLDVPDAVFEQRKAAPSRGRLFAAEIRGTYRYVRLR